jgi:hypothetical protein
MNIPYNSLRDSLISANPNWKNFLDAFTLKLVGIGPDTSALFQENLKQYLDDPGIRQISQILLVNDKEIDKSLATLESGLERMELLVPGWNKPLTATFIGGFDQSFAAIDKILAIGLENYLGDTCTVYDQMGIPQYIQEHMNPANLPGDGLRAWIYSEMPQMPAGTGFLDQMIFQGKVYFLVSRMMPDLKEENLFKYTVNQLEWCKSNEKAMWKFLAEQNILFSTDRFQVRRFFDEAPFTRDFGNDSPGRTGAWIGFRLVSKYMRSTGSSIEELIAETDARKILATSNYHP